MVSRHRRRARPATRRCARAWSTTGGAWSTTASWTVVSGNLSARAGDLIAITPSGVPYQDMARHGHLPGPVTDGSLVGLPTGAQPPGAACPPRPRCTWPCTGPPTPQRSCTPIRAFVVALSTVLDELRRAVHYAMAGLGGLVRVTPYARFGTQELRRRRGSGADGPDRGDPPQSWCSGLRRHPSGRPHDRARTLEWLASVYWHA